MKKILTGLQPTGTITLGNYIGAIKQMVNNQNKYNSYLFVADMHAITIKQDPITLHQNIKDLLAIYLACGIDPQKNTIFIQSENEYHTNISWMLECNTSYGVLTRMTQFKDKSKKNEKFTCGLLTYPVLMAADILAYDVDYVPVGIDQKQHVELARDIAINFNKTYGETFKIPEPLITETGTKIMDLINPTKKMSKSSENQNGVIRILDSETDIRNKIMKATTDSDNQIKFDMENKPGISNLLNIYSALTGISIEKAEQEFKNSSYAEFKKVVADVVVEELMKIQKKYHEIVNSNKLDEILDNGIKITRKEAKAKTDLMKKRIGLGR